MILNSNGKRINERILDHFFVFLDTEFNMTRVFVINNQDLPSIEKVDRSDTANHLTTQKNQKIT